MSFLRSLAALLLAVNTAAAQSTSQPSFFLQDPSDGKPFVAPLLAPPASLALVGAAAGNKFRRSFCLRFVGRDEGTRERSALVFCILLLPGSLRKF